MSVRLLLPLLAGAALLLGAGTPQAAHQEAIETCEAKVRAIAMTQLSGKEVRFSAIKLGRSSVGGTAAVGYASYTRNHRFSCPVDPTSGFVGEARVDGSAGAGRRASR
jgi:hypothetical protein